MDFIAWMVERLSKAGALVSVVFVIIAVTSLFYGFMASPFNTIVGTVFWIFLMHHVYRKTE